MKHNLDDVLLVLVNKSKLHIVVGRILYLATVPSAREKEAVVCQ